MHLKPGVLLAIGALLVATPARAEGPTKETCISANEDADVLRRRGALRAARTSLAACQVEACPKIVREDCIARLKEVEAAIPTLVFTAKEKGVEVAGVSVSIDGAAFLERLDGTPQAVDPGEHVFRFSLEGYPVQTLKLDVREGQKDRAEVVLFGPQPPPPPKDGRLVVAAETGSRITIDGATTVADRFEGILAPGRHEIRVIKTGKLPAVRSVDIQAGETQTLDVALQNEPKKASSFPLPLIIAGAAVVAVGLVVGGYFVFAAD